MRPSVARVPVDPAPRGPKPEPVSGRLKLTLTHPSLDGPMGTVAFTPDGRRVVGAGYPDGCVAVWDAATGKELARFNAGTGGRGSADFVSLSPDGTTAYAAHSTRSLHRYNRDGERVVRFEYDGEVRAFDLATGAVRRAFRHDAPRDQCTLALSPDGRLLLAGEQLPGEERDSARVGLWDTRTGAYRSLPEGVEFNGLFSPDSKSVAVTAVNEDGDTTALKLFDTATLRERWSVPPPTQFTTTYLRSFTPDGRRLVGTTQALAGRKNWREWRVTLRVWDAATGRELAAFPAEAAGTHVIPAALSPDGGTLAVTTSHGPPRKLYLLGLDGLKLRNTFDLPASAAFGEAAFSPDGRTLAVVTRDFPGEVPKNARPTDLPQPRVLLIDAASGRLRETVVLPHGFTRQLAFSPDGKTLATGGAGRVHLWDLAK